MHLYFSPIPFLWPSPAYFVIVTIITREALRGRLTHLEGWRDTVVVLSSPIADFSDYDFFSVEARSMIIATVSLEQNTAHFELLSSVHR